jgi:hypothetical protein
MDCPSRALLHLLRQLESSRSSRTVEHVHHGIQEPGLGDALEMDGFHGNPMENPIAFYGFYWILLDVYGFLWIFMDVYSL